MVREKKNWGGEAFEFILESIMAVVYDALEHGTNFHILL